jgi:transcriptional regulator with XRE-family HTH domain
MYQACFQRQTETISAVIFFYEFRLVSSQLDFDKEIRRAVSNIRRFRELKNLTRDHLSSELSISPSGYAKIERGEIDLTLKRLYQIATILQVDIYKLLHFEMDSILQDGHQQDASNGFISLKGQDTNSDTYLLKYVKKLEEENDQLKSELMKYRYL